MGNLEKLGTASNERRTQNIMALRQGFNAEKYNTINDAVTRTGYTAKTITQWAVDGDIPLTNEAGRPVVPITTTNQRKINNKFRHAQINRLCELFYEQQATTVIACASQMGFPEATIIDWAIRGDVPLLTEQGTPLVPLNETNTPYWFDELIKGRTSKPD